jgi:type IV pilus assembly protein PilN
MIKINLLAGERKAAKKTKIPLLGGGGGGGGGMSIGGGGGGISFGGGSKLTIVCALILVVAALAIGWRFLSITRESAKLDQDISDAQQETARLHTIIQQVQQFEQRRAQLQQRVALIEELRKQQTGPVHMLDQISKALPEMVWLTALKQNALDQNEVLIDGRATTQTGVSDYVANLEASGYFKRSVEIVTTQVETITGPPGELIKFQLRGMFQQPGMASASSATAAAGSATAPATATKKSN